MSKYLEKFAVAFALGLLLQCLVGCAQPHVEITPGKAEASKTTSLTEFSITPFVPPAIAAPPAQNTETWITITPSKEPACSTAPASALSPPSSTPPSPAPSAPPAPTDKTPSSSSPPTSPG